MRDEKIVDGVSMSATALQQEEVACERSAVLVGADKQIQAGIVARPLDMRTRPSTLVGLWRVLRFQSALTFGNCSGDWRDSSSSGRCNTKARRREGFVVLDTAWLRLNSGQARDVAFVSIDVQDGGDAASVCHRRARHCPIQLQHFSVIQLMNDHTAVPKCDSGTRSNLRTR